MYVASNVACNLCTKKYLGALDWTFINVRVLAEDSGRYRTRKGQIATNVLAVCDTELKFIFVLSGWEGSTSDARILRNPGFMAPYRGVMYHLKEWDQHLLRRLIIKNTLICVIQRPRISLSEHSTL
ncbi:hypothetical protein ACS0TY_024106 [Phlomoides rotata]